MMRIADPPSHVPVLGVPTSNRSPTDMVDCSCDGAAITASESVLARVRWQRIEPPIAGRLSRMIRSARRTAEQGLGQTH